MLATKVDDNKEATEPNVSDGWNNVNVLQSPSRLG
jgi:hypothetical protein